MGNTGPCRRRAIYADRAKQQHPKDAIVMTVVTCKDILPDEMPIQSIADNVQCPKCGKAFKTKGLGKHLSACDFNKKKLKASRV